MQDLQAKSQQVTLPGGYDYVLVDGSGSMMSNWWNFLAAADIMIDDMRKAGVNSHCVVHVFDSGNLEMIQRDEPLQTMPSFKQQPLGSNFGGTPLYDAINLMARRMAEKDPPPSSILIVTDGADTSSQTDVAMAAAMIKWLKAKGHQVTFLGFDFNNNEQARMLGATESNTIAVARAKITDATKSYAAKRAKHAKFGDPINFSEDERKNFGGYLTSK